jgi:soluble lytic murein transglycosylase
MEALGPFETPQTLTPVVGRLAFLRAILAQRLQQPDTAQRAYTLVWLAYPPLADYAAWELAQYHAAQDDVDTLDTLVTTLSRRYPASLLLPNCQLLLAQTQWRLGRAAEARMTLGRFLHEYPSHRAQPEALFLLAQIAEANGERVRAAELLQQLGEASPRHALAAAAFRQGRMLLEQVPATQRPPVDPDRLLATIDPLVRAQQWPEVEARLSTLTQLQPSAALVPRTLLVQAIVASRRRRWREAETLLQRLQHDYPQSEQVAQSSYLLAQLFRRQGKEAESEPYYLQVITQHAESPWAAEALLELADLLAGRDQFSEASVLLQRVAQRFATHEKAPYSLWQAAWFHYRQQDYDTAAQLWRRFEQQFPGDALLPGVLYWQARVAQQRHDSVTATDLYRRILSEYPFHYYSQLAQEKLQQASAMSLPTSATPRHIDWEALGPVPLSSATPAGQPNPIQFHLIRVRELQQLQMASEASQEIGALVPLLPDTHATRYFLATLYAGNQRYLDAFRHLNSILSELPPAQTRELPRGFWMLLYPRQFWHEVTAQTEANDLDPYLVLSIMRQESAFDRLAVSSANARGLMQVLPATAQKLSRQLRIRHFATRMLFEPQANIILGTSYFAAQLQRYQGNRILALAAYNAGPNRVDRWRQRWPDLPMDEFVEQIPFEETRLYVKLVLRNLMIYERLYKPVPDS